MEHKKLISIGEVARQTGMSVRRVRYLSDKNYIQQPILSVSGGISYRYYTQNHIEQLKHIKMLQDEGYTLKIAAMKAGLEVVNRK